MIGLCENFFGEVLADQRDQFYPSFGEETHSMQSQLKYYKTEVE